MTLMLITRTVAAAVLLVSCLSCTGSHDAAPPTAEPSSLSTAGSGVPIDSEFAPVAPPAESNAVGPATLPPGALVELVPSPADIPPDYALAEGSGGPLGMTEVADLADDPEVARRALTANGFKDGYSAEYGSEQTGAFISALVQRFATEAGARADYARQVRESAAVAEPLPMQPVGDESAAFREKVPEGDVAEIVSIRFRVRDLVWLIETGGQDAADSTLGHDVAARLVNRTK